MADRVGVEGGDDDRPALVRAALHRAADHGLVAEVKAVEIAERDDRAAKASGIGWSRVRRCIVSRA